MCENVGKIAAAADRKRSTDGGDERIATIVERETRGSLMFLYYRFLSTYGRDAKDLDDLFDGMRNIGAENKITELSFHKD